MKTPSFSKICLMVVMFTLLFSAAILPIKENTVNQASAASIENVSLNNQNFINQTTQTGSTAGSPSGFTRLDGFNSASTNKNLIAGVVNTANTKFNEDYKTEGPSHVVDSSDTYLLMINAQSSRVSMGYRSSSVIVENDAYYKFSVWVYVVDSNASVYLSNENEADKNKRIIAKHEDIGLSNGWHEYLFFVEGNQIKSTNVVMELWLGRNGSDTNDASSGVVFFDNIKVTKLSADVYKTTLNQEKQDNAMFTVDTSLTNLREASIDETTLGYNFGFENYSDNKFDNWTTADGSVVPVQIGVEQTFGYNDENVTLGRNGMVYRSIPSQALLFNSNDGWGQITSKEIEIKRYETYYLTVFAKVSAAYVASITISQTKFLVNGGEVNEKATKETTTQEVTMGDNSGINNGWIKYHFIINGHNLYDCTFTVSLNLGNNHTPVDGYVAFDDLTLTKIDNEEKTAISGLAQVSTLTLAVSKQQSVSNGAFNAVNSVTLTDKLEENLPKSKNAAVSYPIKDVTDWTHKTDETTRDSLIYGIVNTNPVYFAEGNVDGSYGGATNPGLKNGIQYASTTNNVLMLTNKSLASQQFTSPSFSLGAYSYSQITLLANKHAAVGNAYIQIVEGQNVIASIPFSVTSGWQRFNFYIKSGSASKTVNIVLALGMKNQPANGTVYFDDVEFNTIDETAYNLAAANTTSNKKDLSYELFDGIYENLAGLTYLKDASGIADFTNGGNNDYGIYNAYEEAVPDYLRTSQKPLWFSNDAESNVLYVKNHEFSNSTLGLKSKFSFAAGDYYRLLVYVKTHNIVAQDEILENPTVRFGLDISLSGIKEKFSGIKGSTDSYVEYAFYIPADESIESTLTFTLGTAANKVKGEVMISWVQLERFNSKEEYDEALFASQSSLEQNTSFVNVTSTKVPEVPEEITPPGTTPKPTLADMWYLFPSIIMGVVIIIVVFAVMFKQISKAHRQAVVAAESMPLTKEEKIKKKKRQEFKEKIMSIVSTDEARLDELEEQESKERPAKENAKPNKVKEFFKGVITEDRRVPKKKK